MYVFDALRLSPDHAALRVVTPNKQVLVEQDVARPHVLEVIVIDHGQRRRGSLLFDVLYFHSWEPAMREADHEAIQ